MKEGYSHINGQGWRDKYLAICRQAEQDKQVWQQAEQLLRDMVGRLSELSTVVDLPFENRLEALRTSLKDDLPTLKLKPLFDDIRRYLEKLDSQRDSRHGPAEPPLGEGEPDELPLSLQLLDMIDRMPYPAALSQRLDGIKTILRVDTEAGTNHNFLPALAAFFKVLDGFYRSLREENVDMQVFLQDLTGQLLDIREAMRSTEGLQKASSQAGAEIDSIINSATSAIADALATESNIKTLKARVMKRIKTIRKTMVEFKNKESVRHNQSAALIVKLYKRIDQMEQETAALQALLIEKDRQYLTDSLTAIPNRVAYEERIQQECERYVRNKTPVCLLVCDIDNFKNINDSYGHAAGDKVLRRIAEVMQQNIRSIDFVARFGGEEFVVIMPGIRREDAMQVAEKLRRKIEKAHFVIKNITLLVTLSGGLAEFREYDSPASLFERADNALYIAKECGKNRIETE